jgi:hypothetical protein
MRSRLVMYLATVGVLGSVLPGARASGTWTPVTNTAPGGVALMLLLQDGTVMAHNGSGSAWYRLTPDSQGHYINGTWTTLAAMHDTRLYFSSDVLIDGRVFIAGGEYGIGAKTSEVYDPLTNTWTMTPVPGQKFLDSGSKLLPNGKVLVAPVSPSPSGYTALYDPSANTWSLGPKLYRGSSQDEASWVQLPDDSLISIDPFGTNSERYIPSSNTWINDSTVPVNLYNNLSELGAGFLLPDGRVLFLGGTGHTALYTPSGNTNLGTWAAGPDIPNGYGTTDAGACMMPNGKILCGVGSATTYNAPTYFYEYDPVAGSFASVSAPAGASDNIPPYETNMLALPDGTVLYSDFGSRLYVYTPDGTPLAAGKPTIASITQNTDASFHLVGTLLNGISEGAAYGDDGQMATNYPIVRLTSAGGTVYTARAFGRSSTSIMQNNTSMSTEFYLPVGIPSGTYSVTVAANGISSDPVPLVVAPIAISLSAGATEGSAPVNGTVTLPSAATADTVVTLASSRISRATVPASVTVLAGQTSANFTATVIDDALLNGSQSAIISATASGYQGGFANFVVQDNETAVLSVSPLTNFNPAGPQGGATTAFAPSSISYTLTNTGNTSLSWSASKSASWLTVSPSSGTLGAGANVTVTVSLNSGAGSQTVGAHTDTIIFDNISNGNGDTSRSVTLGVSPAVPVLASLPAFTKGTINSFSWTASTGATSYDVQASTSPAFSTIFATQSPTVSSVTFSGLAGGTTYYYRARATGGGYSSAYGNVVSSTQDATVPVVAITSPATGVVYSTTHGTLLVQGTASDSGSGVASVTVNGVAATSIDGFAHWSASVPLANGANIIAATATDNAQTGGNSATGPSITVNQLTSTRGDDLPDSWKTANGLDPNSTAIANGPQGDPEKDGLPNLLEYAFNTNPLAATASPVRSSIQVSQSDGLRYLQLSYPHRIGALDLIYTVEVSDDLKTWSSPGGAIQPLSVVPTGDGITETITVRIVAATENNPQKYARLRVTGS